MFSQKLKDNSKVTYLRLSAKMIVGGNQKLKVHYRKLQNFLSVPERDFIELHSLTPKCQSLERQLRDAIRHDRVRRNRVSEMACEKLLICTKAAAGWNKQRIQYLSDFQSSQLLTKVHSMLKWIEAKALMR